VFGPESVSAEGTGRYRKERDKERDMDKSMPAKCAHEGCSCQAGADSKYGSAYCESARDKTEIACGCEHSQCPGK
jgi:hypothetical protein